MEKYLGNKASLLPLIEAFITSRAPGTSKLSDLFAGTTNVSRYFRARGWTTACCDANRFSYVLAHSYLGLNKEPQFGNARTARPHSSTMAALRAEFRRSVQRYGHLYLPSATADGTFDRLSSLANVLCRLQRIGEASRAPGPITEYFTQWGSRAMFSSVRGSIGSRNYFSRDNALFLDAVLQTIRSWWKEGALTRQEVFLLLTSVIEEVTITANVNGTFHDFNRQRLWPNAEQGFFLRLPLLSLSDLTTELANADAVVAAGCFSDHEVCYIDPPYNFRQYGAYYHFLNFVAAFPFLSDVNEYLEEITHVRGQHPKDNHTSDFCFRDRFIGSLKSLISTVRAKHVVLSYYGGRNHWNHWSTVDEPTDTGLHEIRAVFEDRGIFGSSEVVPALEVRKNYQSRGGERKGLVHEYLFHGIKSDEFPPPSSTSATPLIANESFGLSAIFSHVVLNGEPSRQEALAA